MKVIGEMEDVLIRLSSNEKVCQFIDIVVADIPEAYGLVGKLVIEGEGVFCSNTKRCVSLLEGGVVR